MTGHSLGAGYAIFVGTHAVARRGAAAVADRLGITIFGVPNWGPQSARYYRLTPHVLDRLVTGYTALNDPVRTNGGVDRVGISNFLPPFEGLGCLASLFNPVAAHWPTTYMTALGLPSWLTQRQKSAIMEAVSREFITGDSYDAGYGPAGRTPLIVQASEANDILRGMAGNDRLIGRGGRDELRGGPDQDWFVFLRPSDSGPSPATADRILDFSAEDRLDLAHMDADTTTPGQQSFVRIAARPFAAPGQVTTWSEGETTWIAGNVDRDSGADFMIGLTGVHTLTAPHLFLE